jgi:thiol:disulfide interchange protein DsbD
MTQPDATIKGSLEFMACNDRTCIPPSEINFEHKLTGYTTASATTPTTQGTQNNTESNPKNGVDNKIIQEQTIQIKDGDTLLNRQLTIENGDTTVNTQTIDTAALATTAAPTPPTDKKPDSLASVFGKGLLGGLAALLMPCVFPMIPLTVSFFTKQNEKRKGKGIFQALVYGLSIIVIYVGLGLVLTAVFGSDALNSLSSNIWFNLLCFVLLIAFGASFLGAFEIQLPSSWANFTDKKSNSGGWLGIFFMAATLAIVSFSCTVGIIGYLLVDAAQGAFFAPAVGMFGFALALAVPFALFAAFPSLMGTLPKSGGWLNVVKVVLGFLEIAFAFKFLSNVDLAYHWNLLDREVFLAIWIVLFFLLGWYLLGKIRFELDSPTTHLSVPRFGFAAATLAFAVYMVPGLWGAPLNVINAFLPPMGTQDFVLTQNTQTTAANQNTAHSNTPKKYGDLFHCPHNLDCFFDYNQALAYAKQQNKPLFVDFTGHSCVNCRKMEASVWANDKVLEMLRNDYVVVSLYVDDKTELPAAEQYTSNFSKKRINTVGKKWSDLQASRYNSNAQPQYILLNHQEKTLAEPQGYNEDVNNFVQFLQAGKTNFNP